MTRKSHFIHSTAMAVMVSAAGVAVPAAQSATIDEAEAARKQAAAAGYEWRDTSKIIAKAREAESKGDQAKAQRFAAEAKAQSELAVQQSRQQANNWRNTVPR